MTSRVSVQRHHEKLEDWVNRITRKFNKEKQGVRQRGLDNPTRLPGQRWQATDCACWKGPGALVGGNLNEGQPGNGVLSLQIRQTAHWTNIRRSMARRLRRLLSPFTQHWWSCTWSYDLQLWPPTSSQVLRNCGGWSRSEKAFDTAAHNLKGNGLMWKPTSKK